MKLPSIFRGAQRKSVTINDVWDIVRERGLDGLAVKSPEKAAHVSAVLACVRVVSEGLAMLPYKLYRENENGGRALQRDHAVYKLLARRPNSFQTAFEFRQAIIACAMFGNGYAYITRNAAGQPLELLPINPARVKAKQLENWEPVYEIKFGDGAVRTFTNKNIMHLRGLVLNAEFLASDIVKLAAHSIGLSLSAEEYQSNLAQNGGRPQGIITTDQPLTDKQVQDLKTTWASEFKGAINAGKTAVLFNGFKYEGIANNSEEAQILETRKFSVEEICRFMGVFPQIIGYSDKAATYASAEAFFSAHVQQTLQPWATRFEQVCERDLLTEKEIDDGFYLHHHLQGLLRGDSASRATYYAQAITNGWMTRNEVRALEELNPLDGLDEPLTPLNMTTDPSVNNGAGNAA